ncbi:hypothetical protein POM88_023578 [Heracleum sosnowskyi]|uniref:Uncharacterized protein n=1 Tax=Heracleum sosnowskyi TaxID=360622 RepID=A0AAD8IJT3_9APIA|nr:hypothetical protein POM88_023578 [Heracleum sosnowskyi]
MPEVQPFIREFDAHMRANDPQISNETLELLQKSEFKSWFRQKVENDVVKYELFKHLINGPKLIEEKNGVPPTRLEVWDKTHTRAGSEVDEDGRPLYTTAKAKEIALSSDDEDDVTDISDDEGDIEADAVEEEVESDGEGSDGEGSHEGSGNEEGYGNEAGSGSEDE